jgi:hypothetical protein
MRKNRQNRRGQHLAEYTLAFVIAAFLGMSVWAGMGWWELTQAGSMEARSAFRSALRESSKTDGRGWGVGTPVVNVPNSAGPSGNLPLPTLDMMLQGTMGAASASGVAPAQNAPSIEKGYNEINKVLQGR